ncbi:trimeric autotransporter adhesin Hada [Canicola haemoglobinophilus]|uniref:Trimeric autotransporter adhesin Hada n=1 Tax=Canicola haemoglobinophilus TaxID=733 RepID=A0AB38H9U9_9PAST|nr:YadA C-terminal domain-containing protein [Canicola haemoglobinophilus]STO55383.1 trimeric autotransporter adhesin Hada [Canicola haemoglobinophilus]STO69048.1 trimeric autotransporter adhesin Hada [Canicola haemoglobinophilus]
MKTNFKLLALTAAVGVALSGVAVAESVEKTAVSSIDTNIFEKAGKELQALADKSKQAEEDIAELQNAMDEVENAAVENEVAIDDLQKYVDLSISSLNKDNNDRYEKIYEELHNLSDNVKRLDPNKVSDMVGAADSRLSYAEDSILELQEDVETLRDDFGEFIAENADDIEKNLEHIAKNEADISEVNEVVEKNTADIAKNKADIEKNLEHIAKNEADISEVNEVVEKNTADIEKNLEHIAKNEADISEVNEVVEKNTADIAKNKADIEKNLGYIAKNEADISEVNEVVEKNTADIAKNKAAISQNTVDIAHNSARIDKLNKDLKRGLATQAALSGLFQPYSVGKFNVTAAVGGYKSEVALAVGTGYRFNEKLATKAGVAFNKGGVSYNVGVNYEF